MRVDLARDVRKFIERQGLTQVQAAEFFEVPRPKISHIQSNKLGGISIEYPVRMVAKTGGKPTAASAQASTASLVPRRSSPTAGRMST